MADSKKLTITSILIVISTILQSAGGMIPGIGYFISPLATLPIMISVVISFRFGLMAYVLTNFLLFMIQPSELMIFPFTTGLLGLVIGMGFRLLKKRLYMIILSSLVLTGGILTVLYGLKFPILGPLGTLLSPTTVVLIYFFSLVYTWLWVEISRRLIKKIYKISKKA